MNHKKIILIAAIFVIGSLFFGTRAPSAAAMTAAEIQDLIAKLQVQIADLQKQLAETEKNNAAQPKIKPKPYTAQDFREEIFSLYGFTPTAADFIRSNSSIEVLDLNNNCGGGWFASWSKGVQLNCASPEAAVHELSHVWWHDYRIKHPEIKKAFVRDVVNLINLDPRYSFQYEEVIDFARGYVYGIGDWKGMYCHNEAKVQGDKCVKDVRNILDSEFGFDTDDLGTMSVIIDWEIYAGFSSYTMGKFKEGKRKLPEFMWKYFEPEFTGNVSTKPYYESKKEATLWDWDFCRPDKQCGAGEGDCDTNADCVSGLYCAKDVGKEYGQTSTMDVCQLKAKIPTTPESGEELNIMPEMIYPLDGQTLNYGPPHSYMFKVKSIAGASGYLYKIIQNDVVVYDNWRDSQRLSADGAFSLFPGDKGYSSIKEGEIEITVRALKNNQWTKERKIKIKLISSASAPISTPVPVPVPAPSPIAAPEMVYPADGQMLSYGSPSWYMFKVKPITGASGYFYEFIQNGVVVFDNANNLSADGTLNLYPGQAGYSSFKEGEVTVNIQAIVNGQRSPKRTIKIKLTSSIAVLPGVQNQVASVSEAVSRLSEEIKNFLKDKF